MTDKEITELYFARSEDAIKETEKKYGAYCRCLTMNILGNALDSEECVNDTYMKLWSVIPPKKPSKLGAFIAKIARNLALDRLDRAAAGKRHARQADEAFDEIAAYLPDSLTVEKAAENNALTDALDRFLSSLPKEKRVIFMKRYWHMESTADIARELHISESKVKMTTLRTREKLGEFLKKEGFGI